MLDIGLMDDDQLIIMMAYRKKKDIFMLHKSNWFMPLKENGASHLSVKEIPKIKKESFLRKAKKYYRQKEEIHTYLKRVKRDLED